MTFISECSPKGQIQEFLNLGQMSRVLSF